MECVVLSASCVLEGEELVLGLVRGRVQDTHSRSSFARSQDKFVPRRRESQRASRPSQRAWRAARRQSPTTRRAGIRGGQSERDYLAALGRLGALVVYREASPQHFACDSSFDEPCFGYFVTRQRRSPLNATTDWERSARSKHRPRRGSRSNARLILSNPVKSCQIAVKSCQILSNPV